MLLLIQTTGDIVCRVGYRQVQSQLVLNLNTPKNWTVTTRIVVVLPLASRIHLFIILYFAHLLTFMPLRQMCAVYLSFLKGH